MTIQDKARRPADWALAMIALSVLSWTVAAHGQEGTAGNPSAAVTTEKGKAIAPAGAPQKTGAPAVGTTVQPNGPGSAGTSSNPLAHGPAAPGPGSAKTAVNPENGVYSGTDDKGQDANRR